MKRVHPNLEPQSRQENGALLSTPEYINSRTVPDTHVVDECHYNREFMDRLLRSMQQKYGTSAQWTVQQFKPVYDALVVRWQGGSPQIWSTSAEVKTLYQLARELIESVEDPWAPEVARQFVLRAREHSEYTFYTNAWLQNVFTWWIDHDDSRYW